MAAQRKYSVELKKREVVLPESRAVKIQSNCRRTLRRAPGKQANKTYGKDNRDEGRINWEGSYRTNGHPGKRQQGKLRGNDQINNRGKFSTLKLQSP